MVADFCGMGRLKALPQPELETVESQRRALEMALEKLTIIVGQRLPGAAGAEVLRSAATTNAPPQRRNGLLP